MTLTRMDGMVAAGLAAATGRLSALAASLVLGAAALALAPGVAWGQACGAIPANRMVTCTDQAYTGGISYNAGTASLSLTVGGGAATTITLPTNNSVGIALTAAPNGATGDQTLTVGSAGAVAIVPGSGVTPAQGISLTQYGSGTARGEVSDRVTIGSASNPVTTGVSGYARGAGGFSLTSAATIHAATAGLTLWRPAESGTTTPVASSIENRGAIMTSGDGIRVEYATPSAATQTGAVTVTNSGAITVTGDGYGIRLSQVGPTTTAFNPYGDLMLTNSGAITATDPDGNGIDVVFAPGNTASSGDITIANSGAIAANRYGIRVVNHGGGDIGLTNTAAIASTTHHAIFARARQNGAIDIDSSGDLSAAEANMRGIMAQADGDGDVDVTASAGAIRSANAQGIYVLSAGAGAVTVSSGADITAQSHGIQVAKTGTEGDISITTTGGAITVERETTSAHGIFVQDVFTRSGSIAIVNAADITVFGEGIYVDLPGNRDNIADRQERGGDVTVTQMGGTVLSRWASGIRVRNKQFNDVGDVTVAAMGGTVQSAGWATPAITALNRGRGDAIVTIAAGATVISLKDDGVRASLSERATHGAADNQVKIEMGGAILGRSGVSAQVLYNAAGETSLGSGEMVAARAATAPPVIDIAWTGSFGAGTTAQTAPNDDDRFVALSFAGALNPALQVEAGKATGVYGAAAGIEAFVLGWRREVMLEVAKGDDPNAAAQMNLLSETHADSRRAAILAQVRAVLGSAEIEVREAVFSAIESTATSLDDLTDAEIVTWLGMPSQRGTLRNVLAQTFSDAERAVLRALAMGDGAGLDAALEDAEAAFSDAYKATVRALLDRYHAGDIRIAMSDGSIVSRGDGIRAYYATYNENNGAIDITVGEGAEVSGAKAGILVTNAGLGEDADGDDIRKQSVTVNGMVTGGTDAAVHLVGGGTLTVGESGVLVAGAGRPAVLVNEPGRSAIQIAGEVRGGAGAMAAMDLSGGGSVTVTPTGRINTNENGADSAIRVSGGAYQVAIYAPGTELTKDGVNRAIARVQGGIDTGSGGSVTTRPDADGEVETGQVSYAVVEMAGDYSSGRYLPLELDAAGEPITVGNAMYEALGACPTGQELQDDGACVTPPPPPDMPGEGGEGGGERPPPAPALPMNCAWANGDCRLYEALPSALLAMNDLPSYGERMAAARSGNGGWARVENARGDWNAASSTQPNLAYDYDRNGVRAGIDMALGESGRFGMAVHGLGGSADVTQSGGLGGGKIEMTGLGVGANATVMAGAVYIDAQAAATWFDVDIASATGTELKQDARATGYALALEAGRPMAVKGGVTLTPRAGLAWSRVALEDFTDSRAARRVALEDASSMTGRLGVGMTTRVPGGMTVAASLDAMRKLSQETGVMFEGTRLKATGEATSVRLGLGAAHSWGEDRYGLQASAGWTAGAGDNNELAGGLSLSVRF